MFFLGEWRSEAASEAGKTSRFPFREHFGAAVLGLFHRGCKMLTWEHLCSEVREAVGCSGFAGCQCLGVDGGSGENPGVAEELICCSFISLCLLEVLPRTSM